MLTSEQAIVNFEGDRAVPDRLLKATHRHYVEHARAMVQLYRNGKGEQRRQLHRRVEALFYREADCPPRRIAAFCKLLDDASTWHAAPDAWKLRLEVFRRAAKRHPLVERPDRLFESRQQDVKQDIAVALGRPWDSIEADLYADVISCQRLGSFSGYDDPADLLSRYNVAQLQACCFRARRMTIRATNDFKAILRYVKLARLLHRIRRRGRREYEIDLTGPASPLRATRRYGVNFARFLPALLACNGWWLRAELLAPWGRPAWLDLSDRDGFHSHLPVPSEFDSTVEEKFSRKFGRQRDGWTLAREGVILHRHQRTFVPDFVFHHEDGTEVLMEIVGFWTPQYLDEKRDTLRAFRGHRILLAVQQGSVRPGAQAENLVVYKTVLKLQPVLDALERLRAKRL
jgi:predicted nuclease of restriction endonuclease-like RecB superfamily